MLTFYRWLCNDVFGLHKFNEDKSFNENYLILYLFFILLPFICWVCNLLWTWALHDSRDKEWILKTWHHKAFYLRWKCDYVDPVAPFLDFDLYKQLLGLFVFLIAFTIASELIVFVIYKMFILGYGIDHWTKALLFITALMTTVVPIIVYYIRKYTVHKKEQLMNKLGQKSKPS